MSSMMGMLPGIGKVKKQIDAAGIDDSIVKRQRAIISSMTPKERRNPKILDGKRKRRIAAGSGTKVEEVNKLIKMHRQMADMMKTMGKRGGLMQRMMGGGGGGAEPGRDGAHAGRARPRSIRRRWRTCPRTEGAAAEGPARPGRRRPAEMPGLPGLGGGAPRLPGLPGCRGRRNEARDQGSGTRG